MQSYGESESMTTKKAHNYIALMDRVTQKLDSVETLLVGTIQTHPFKEALKDWTDIGVAAALMGRELGVYPVSGEPTEDQKNAMRASLYGMSETGTIDLTFDTDTGDDKVRWNKTADLG